MNKLLTSLLCLFVVFTLAQAAQDTYKQNPYLGKPDNIGQFDKYSSNLNEVGRKFKNYTALATYSSNGRMSKEDKPITPESFGAIGDGASHTIESAGYNLSQAQNRWPHAGVTSILQELDWAAIQEAVGVAKRFVKRVMLAGRKYFIGNSTIDLSNPTTKDAIPLEGVNGGTQAGGNTTIFYNGTSAAIKITNTNASLSRFHLSAFNQFSGGTYRKAQGIVFASTSTAMGRLQRNRFDLNGITVTSFKDNIVSSAIPISMFNSASRQPSRYGLILDNPLFPDGAAGTITDSQFIGRYAVDNTLRDAGIYNKSLGALKLKGSYFFGHYRGYWLDQHNYPSELTAADSSVILLIQGNQFDGNVQAIRMAPDSSNPGLWAGVSITGNQFTRYYPIPDAESTALVYLNNISGSFNGNAVYNGDFTGTALQLEDTYAINATGNSIWGFDTGIDIESSAVDTLIGSNTVTDNTTSITNDSTSTIIDVTTRAEGKLTYDNTNKILKNTSGGTIAPKLDIEFSEPSAISFPALRVISYGVEYGALPIVSYTASRGTKTAPGPLLNNDVIAQFKAFGRGTTGAKTAGILEWGAAEDFTDANQKTNFLVKLGNTGTNDSPATVLTVQPDGYIAPTAGVKFPDNTTQATAFRSAPPNAINYYIQLNNGSNGLTYDDGFYYASNKLTAEDLELTTANPTFITDDYTTTGAKTCPSSTIFKGLSDRIPLIAANYYPVMNSGGTAYTAGLQYTNGTGNIIEGSGTYHIAAGAANDGTFRSYYKNGTTAPAAADVRVGGVFGGALDGTTQRISWEVAGFTGSAWTYGSDQPSYVRIATTPDGTATRTEKLRVADNGLLTFSNGGGVPFGTMYTDTSLTVTVSAANTWYEVNTGATDFTAGLLKGVTHSDHYLVAATAGYYQVKACASLGTGVAGYKVAINTAVNGTAASYGHGHTTIANANSTSQACALNILNLAANDQVSIVVQNHSGASNIDIDHAQLIMEYIGSP